MVTRTDDTASRWTISTARTRRSAIASEVNG